MQKIDDTSIDKAPPQDRQAEMSLLGALMIDNSFIPNVCTIISRDDFYDRRHQSIFEAIVILFEQNVPVDLVTVTDKLVTLTQLEQIGGRAYLIELTEDVYSAANCERYAEIVKEKSILRRLMNLASTIYSKAQRQEGEVKELLDEAESKVFEIATRRTDKGFQQIKNLLPATFNKMEELDKLKGQITGLATSMTELDNLTAGMHGGEFIVIAGRPGMGKTAFALRIMENVAVEQGKGCAIFSLEMSSEQIVQRLLCSRARVGSHRLRTGSLRDHEWTNLNIAAGPLAESPIYIDDSASMTVWDFAPEPASLRVNTTSDWL